MKFYYFVLIGGFLRRIGYGSENGRRTWWGEDNASVFANSSQHGIESSAVELEKFWSRKQTHRFNSIKGSRLILSCIAAGGIKVDPRLFR
jgi:hypothetical protein